MFRTALRPYFAALLLLCLGRTLLPEAWVLAWHPHEHTIYESAYHAREIAGKPRLLLTVRHRHCFTEQFYNVPFVPGSAALAPRPCARVRYLAFTGARPAGCSRLALCQASLRGPPALARRRGGLSGGAASCPVARLG